MLAARPMGGHPTSSGGLPFLGERTYSMLLVVTIRREGERYALGHICDSGCMQVFCGVHIPAPVIECGMDDPSNPYVGKVPASCGECVSEFNNGRREGFREKV